MLKDVNFVLKCREDLNTEVYQGFLMVERLVGFAATARYRDYLNMTLGELTSTKPDEEPTYIPKDKIIATSLLFARELEQIV